MKFFSRKQSAILIAVILLLALALSAWAIGKTKITRYGKGYRFNKNGWIYVHIEGKPYERGFQHGYLVAKELKEIMRVTKFVTYWNTGKNWDYFKNAAIKLFAKKIDQEIMDEIKGIADGAKKAGVNISWQDVFTWNVYYELLDYWWPNQEEGKFSEGNSSGRGHCSAFIATGSATADGGIVMAHNSWCNFTMGQFMNEILDIVPEKGHRMFMQSLPGYVYSMTDFFITSAGIVGTETTIGGFKVYNPDGSPEFYRVRKAMQYGNTLDDFVKIMAKNNTGGYANSWLIGNIKTGEIMRFELGLKYYSITKKKDGYFIGFNAPIDPRIRNLECSNTGFADIRRHQGARQVRLTQLMREYYGKINAEIAKKILADHYDVYLHKINPCSRTIDGHYELDAREFMCQPGRPLPFQPRGTVDGKVLTTALAKKMSFWARWGNSSGMPFYAEGFLKRHIQWEYLRGYLKDRPSEPWVLFKASER